VEAYESDLRVASEVAQARVTEVPGAETYEGKPAMDYLLRLSQIPQ
jgi:hypothetical protein